MSLLAKLPVVPLVDNLADQPLGIFGASRLGQQLQVGQVPDQILVAGEHPDPETRRQDLGKAGHEDHPIQLIESGEPWRGIRMAQGEDGVLDDVEVVTLRKFQKLERVSLGDAGAGRVLDDRRGDEKAGTVRLCELLEPFQIRSFSCPRHPVDNGPQGAHVSEPLVEAGIVDKDSIVGPDEVTGHKVHAAGDAVGQQDLLRTRFDAMFRKQATDMRAQRGIAQRVSIAAVQAVDLTARQFAHGPVQPVLLQPGLRQPPAAGPVPEAFLVRLLPQEPEYVPGLGCLQFHLARLIQLARPVDVEAGAGPRLDLARHDELVVGVHDRKLADIVGSREMADGRQAGAGTKYALLDQACDPLDDLLRKRRALRRIKTNQHDGLPRVETFKCRRTSPGWQAHAGSGIRGAALTRCVAGPLKPSLPAQGAEGRDR